jgi:hypothetical protein
MIRKITGFSLLGTALLGFLPLACQPGGVGDPCTPEDEYDQQFAGYGATEVNTESKSFQCETRVCLVNHFQGRVSCKYGQDTPVAGTASPCHVPGDPTKPILTEVTPQLKTRQADQAVYCSCRCDGPDPNARYCKCPSGYECSHLRDALNIPGAGAQLAGSYCIISGTDYNVDQTGVGNQCTPTGGVVQKDGTITGSGTNGCGVAEDG